MGGDQLVPALVDPSPAVIGAGSSATRGAVAVFESVQELRERLDETPLGESWPARSAAILEVARWR
jgi:hypothetical protein